ncbi:MAG TPA: hypothetical protein VGE36_11015 [Roseateles sp.]
MPHASHPRRQLLALPLLPMCLPAWGGDAPVSLQVPAAQGYSRHGAYFVDLVRLALGKTGSGEPPPRFSHPPTDLPRERLRQMLQDGRLDLLWSTTSPEREAQALPVRFDLLKGANELRLLLVRAADLPALRHVRTLQALRRWRAGSGTYWSDAGILRANGFKVETASKFELLFPMLKAGRFDFIPRTREEIRDELDRHAGQGLAELPGLALQYRQPLYFFVTPGKPWLAQRLQRGLELAAADGSFDALFMAEPGLKKALADLRAYPGRRLQLRAR